MMRGARLGINLALIALGSAASLRADDAPGSDLIGARVVQKAEGFSLRGDDATVVARGRQRIEIYRVERAEGPKLWLHAPGLEGWAQAEEVVSVDRAVAHFTEYIRDHPGDPFGYTMRATIRQKVQNDLKAALDDYNEAVRVAPAASHVYNNRANAYVSKRDYDRAIADYGEALRLVPGNAIAWTNRGLAWAAKREYRRAIDDHDHAIGLNPDYATAYLNRANARRALKDFDRAVADYGQAIRIDPRYLGAYLGRGAAYLGAKQPGLALADFDEAIRIDPKSAVTYNSRGQARSSLKDYDGALADFDEAVRLDPKFVLAYSNRGLTRRVQGNPARAIPDFDEAARLDPKASFVLNNRGIARSDLGQSDRARADFDGAILADPTSSLPRRNRAVLALVTGRDTAESDARAAIDCDGWWSESSIYAVLIGHFGARRAGRVEAADRLLLDAFRRCDASAWPYPVVRYLRREIDESALLALADDDDKRTEVHCYLGLDLALSGRPKPARDHFRWAVDHGNRTFMEYSISVAELKRIDAAPRP